MEARRLRWQIAKVVMGFLQGQFLGVPHQPGEEVGGERTGCNKLCVGATVGHTGDRVLIAHHFADLDRIGAKGIATPEDSP